MLQPTQSSGAIYQYLPMGHRLHMQLRAVHEGNRKEHAKHRAEHVYRRRQARNAARCFAVNRGGGKTRGHQLEQKSSRAFNNNKTDSKTGFQRTSFQASQARAAPQTSASAMNFWKRSEYCTGSTTEKFWLPTRSPCLAAW